jgi:hypothetical protein
LNRKAFSKALEASLQKTLNFKNNKTTTIWKISLNNYSTTTTLLMKKP